jgi:drug/metabolite transporter (DMT)-like permease
MVVSGLLFTVLNALVRSLSQQFDPYQTQFLRYFFGLLVLVPWIVHSGPQAFKPQHVGSHFLRGGLHTVGLWMWFSALPQIPLADTTAIGFTGPIFVMLGAYWLFREPMRWERWLATGLGFAGVMVVVWPKLSWSAAMTGSGGGWYHLIMLASSPVFAASFLLTKAQTKFESPRTILVWQCVSISLLSLPAALMHWTHPHLMQWCLFALCGLLGSAGHYCQTRAIHVADVGATQSPKFLELVWAACLGWIAFGDVPSQSTLIGGLIISAATLWVSRREARGKGALSQAP